MTPVMQAASDFALVGGVAFTAVGVYLSVRQRRVHPLLLLCISAISFSWIEASTCDWSRRFSPPLHRYRAALSVESYRFCGSATPSPSPSDA
jgi:hypothetical protein